MRKVLILVLLIAAVLTVSVKQGWIKKEDEPDTAPHRYEVVTNSLTWEEASAAALDRGGHLAAITSQQEFEKIVALCQEYGDDIKCFWLGGIRDGDTYKWCTGEKVSDKYWYPGEPSFYDGSLEEKYMCLWPLGDWSFNDQANDVPYASAYVIEYE